jgi:tRNA 5-methylaminomethyl-2-thiouridine biosynthesis bifunctional protein
VIPALWGGYAIPSRSGLLFGATHDRGETGCERRPDDDARNLAALRAGRPALAAALDVLALDGRASVRAATPDFLPLAGEVPGGAGLYILSGLGSRGFCAAPLLAEHVAALATGAPSPLPAALQAIVDPARFTRRRHRRVTSARLRPAAQRGSPRADEKPAP